MHYSHELPEKAEKNKVLKNFNLILITSNFGFSTFNYKINYITHKKSANRHKKIISFYNKSQLSHHLQIPYAMIIVLSHMPITTNQ